MPTRVQRSGDLATLFLDEPRGNALSTAAMERLNEALTEIENTAPRAVVLAGRERIFCGGLDLIEVAGLTKEELATFVDRFEAIFLRLLTFPIPLVAAIGGHALAGGAVIALACDHRVMKDGPFQIGLNEVELGLPFPSVALEIARFGLPPRAHTEAIAFGRRYDPQAALACGFVHELHEDPLARAHEIAARITTLGPDAVALVRAELRREHVERAKLQSARTRSVFVDAVASDEVRQRVVRVVEALRNKN
jgi:enoyl-CoA hydratase